MFVLLHCCSSERSLQLVAESPPLIYVYEYCCLQVGVFETPITFVSHCSVLPLVPTPICLLFFPAPEYDSQLLPGYVRVLASSAAKHKLG